MKKLVILIVFVLFYSRHLDAQPIFSEKGYPEHFIAGAIIGGGVSYLVFKKTDNKFKAWAFGTIAASAVGFLKEAVDPDLLSGVRSTNDALYTSLGGAFGASIVIPLKSRKTKEKPNIAAAFKNSPIPKTKNYVLVH